MCVFAVYFTFLLILENLFHFHRMPSEDDLQMGLLKKGLREILKGKLSQREAALKYSISRQTFKRYLAHFDLKSPSEVRYIEKIQTGAPPYLSVRSLLILTLFGHALDSMDFQLTFEMWREKIFNMKKKEYESKEASSVPTPPCEMTVRSIIQKLKLPQKSVREGPSVDAMQETKANSTYLCDYFDKIEDLFQREKITPDRIWNCDEVGVQLSDMNLHMYSTKKTVRRNLCTDHLTAHLTVSALGNIMPLYLIFPGEGIADIPESVSSSSEIWSNWSPNRWMDEERFQAYMLLNI